MNRSFEKIVSLSLQHDYYNSGVTTDITLTPTVATKQLLERHKWIFKPTANGCFISGDHIAITTLPLILAEKTITLSFILNAKNNDFMNFTNLPSRPDSRHIYYFQSQPGSEGLMMEVVPLCPQVFTYTFPAAGNTTHIQVTAPEGNIPINDTFSTSPGQQLSTAINLKGHTPGLYRFSINGQPDENRYITDEPQYGGSFGIANITLPENFNPQTSGAYRFQFQTRASVWEYHLLLGKDYNGYTIAIEDTIEENTFTETAIPSNYDKGSRSTFTAQVPVPYREAARKGIQLTLTAGDGTSSTINHLPGPAVSNPEPKIYLTI